MAKNGLENRVEFRGRSYDIQGSITDGWSERTDLAPRGDPSEETLLRK
jgi:hypothetical protein